MRAAAHLVAVAALAGAASPALGEYASYGRVELTGLARDVEWPLIIPGPAIAMVCNVDGPDGTLTVRTGPGEQYALNRTLGRLAIVEVDTALRHGHWIRVNTAYRTFTPDGEPQEHQSLWVSGWARDEHLCAFLDN